MMFKRKQKKNYEIEPDEIFLDSSNIPDFDTYQFEGRIEKTISRNTVLGLGIFFVFISLVFVVKIGFLQISEGSSYVSISENNRLNNIPIFSERGVIYDRNNIELVWNVPNEDEKAFSQRVYNKQKGLAHIVGYVNYPAKDKAGFYWKKEYKGQAGIEKRYNNYLQGKNGLRIIETDALMNIKSESIIEPPQNGKEIILTIDSRVQSKLFELIEKLSKSIGFKGGAGVLLDINSGEVLSLVSFPEYNSGVLSSGKKSKVINSYLNDPRKPFLNRAISGLYTPGSIVKPFMAMGALNEGIITPEKKILSTGSISIPNPYYPKLKSVFNDWRAQGWVDMRKALAVSSNVYFYEIGGGFKDQKGLGIANIEKYTKMFGLGKITNIDLDGEIKGVIPNPEWKARNFKDGEWRIGDTYHTVIGQYGFQVTPLQMVRAIALLANGGKPITPFLILNNKDRDIEKKPRLKLSSKYFEIIKEGMRQAVLEGTAKGLNIPQVAVAAKTGTAEIGLTKKLVNSWIVGFFPYKNPRFAFTIVMEKGPRENLIGGLYVMRQLLEWMAVETPEYLESK